MSCWWLVLCVLVAAEAVPLVPVRPMGASFTATCDIVRSYGYPCEEHSAPTPDGWILSVKRIPHGVKGKSLSVPQGSTRPVVFFQHGLVDCSVGSVLNGPDQSFPFILADNGYDVWLGNNRGNGVSMTNIHYKPSDKEFWDFTWDEMAMYDLPSQLQYVINTTGVSKVTYMGHSEGTVQAFSGFLNPKTAAMVNLFVALAPVAYVKHIESLLIQALGALETDKLFELLGIRDFAVSSVIEKLLSGVCKITPSLCEFDIALVCGPTHYLNASRISYYAKYETNPTSVKNMAHWAQGVRKQSFQMFDYGAEGNLKRYNQSSPPQYELKYYPTDLPTALFTGTEDYLAPPKDVELLLAQLPIKPFVHNEPHYAHLDPLLGYNANTLIYPIILNLIKQYNTV